MAFLWVIQYPIQYYTSSIAIQYYTNTNAILTKLRFDLEKLEDRIIIKYKINLEWTHLYVNCNFWFIILQNTTFPIFYYNSCCFFVWHCPVLLYMGQNCSVLGIAEFLKNSNTNTIPAGIVNPCLVRFFIV